MSDTPLRCIVVTPEETVLDAHADFVALPLFDGELGVANGHSPFIGRLGYGEMRLRAGTASNSFYVDGGFVQVAGNTVSVLTNRAIPATKLDVDQATEQLSSGLSRKATGDEQLVIRDRVITQARAQLRVARKAK
jgi:F-type H+-transporting ATPase subunit epsilon